MKRYNNNRNVKSANKTNKGGNRNTRNTRRNDREVREEPSKDSKDRRVNYDNTRVSKFEQDTGCSNDPSWYASNELLLQAAASIPFAWTTGMPFDFNQEVSVPGVCALHFVPFMGTSYGAINQASHQIYSDVVHANSRNQSYDAPDLMTIILAGANVFSIIGAGLRAYGLMRRYEQQDMYTPAGILKALNWDADDLRANYSHMWFDLNRLITETRQLWIPNVMPLIERWFWMNSYVYKDAESVKAQYYAYVQDVYYQYDEKAVNTGGSLQPKTFVANMTWAKYMELVSGMINSMVNSQDRGIMFGDILKAYGADRLYSLSEITADYTIEPVYDREVLSQMENATLWSVKGDYGPVVQDGGSHNLTHLVVNSNQSGFSHYVSAAHLNATAPDMKVLNFHQKETPTAAQIMVATRMMSSGFVVAGQLDPSITGKYYLAPECAGTEILRDVIVWYNSIGEDGQMQLNNKSIANVLIRPATEDSTIDYETLLLYNTFDWAPVAYEIVNNTESMNFPGGSADNTTTTIHSKLHLPVCDYDNYTFLDASTLRKMHFTATYSEFGIRSSL